MLPVLEDQYSAHGNERMRKEVANTNVAELKNTHTQKTFFTKKSAGAPWGFCLKKSRAGGLL